QSFTPLIDGAVSVNIDGLQFSQGLALRSGFFDLAQVEVLKGPQALFFGKNSPGGVIALTSADPTDTFEASAKVGYEFEAEKKYVETVLSGPLSDTLGARLAVSFTDEEGYFENVAMPPAGFGGLPPSSNTFPNQTDLIARLSFAFEPSDKFDASLKLTYQDIQVERDGGSAQIVGCDVIFDPAENCVLDGEAAIADLDPALFGPGSPALLLAPDSLPGGGVPYQDTWLGYGVLEMNYEIFENVTLTSVTGASATEHDFLLNGTYQPATPTIAANNGSYQNAFTQEFRLASDYVSSPFDFMLGAFFEDAEQSYTQQLIIPALGGVAGDTTQSVEIETISVFAQGIWDITDKVELAGGLRWTEEERSLSAFLRSSTNNNPFALAVIPALGEVQPLVPELSSDNVSPEATLTWRPNSNLTLFAGYKEGFKSGSFNLEQAPFSDTSFGEETAEGFEVGVKTLLFNETLRVNASVYDYDYDDLQVSRVVTQPNGATLLQIVNAAAAEVQGFEIDALFAPAELPGLTLFAALNHNEATFTDFPSAACYGGQTIDQGCNLDFSAGANVTALGPLGGFTAQDLTGQTLPKAPELTWSAGFDYEKDLGDSGLTLGVSAQTAYTDDLIADVSYNPRVFQDSYYKTNAALRLMNEEAGWTAELIGNNIGDEVVSSNCFSGPFDQGGGLLPNPSGLPSNPIIPGSFDNGLCFAQPGREVWLRFSVRR
ncbi:MAG: TonB-dependent receptor, partial [Pseudomonadota bacterium]